MTDRAVWFGSHEQPLFGWLHTPVGGRARGGVVLCPTIGVEAMCAHRAMRELATQLQSAGFLVLRFDYEGTGDSSGDESDPRLVETWLASVRSAADLVRAAGVEQLAVVGLRIGATLAAVVAGGMPDLDALVLWDPCATGRSFVREQQALKAMSIGDPHDSGSVAVDAVEILGSVLSGSVVSDLAALELHHLEVPLARRVLVLTRPDRPSPRRLVAALSGDGVEWAEAAGQAELVDVLPDEAVLPAETIERISTWLTGAIRGAPAAVHPVGRPEAHLLAATGGEPIVERPVRLGPLGLFGIVAEPQSGASDGPVVAFLNAGLLHHVGPARLWVLLARRFAAAGMRTVRFDLSGLGDSPRRPGQRPHFSYPKEAIDDIADALEGLSPAHRADAVLVGLCAGAYHAIEGGIALGVRGVCAINPILHFDPPEVWSEPSSEPARQVLQPYSPWIKRLQRFDALARFGEHRAPPVVWWALDKLGLQRHPARALQRLGVLRVETLLICGEVEARPFQRRAKWALRRLVRERRLAFEVLVDADHTLFGAGARQRATELIADYVLSRFAPTRAPAATFVDAKGDS